MQDEEYGKCPNCGYPLAPVWFTEEEFDRHGVKTGRTRRAVSHLLCDACGTTECVTDEFDGPWER